MPELRHSPSIRVRELTLFVADLAGYTRGVADLDARAIATFLDGFYRLCSGAIRSRGGRVVKFMGDGCFAVFEPDAAPIAVDAALAIRAESEALFREGGFRFAVGASVHVARVAEGELGDGEDRRYDVIGAGVNHLFRMGGGPDIRISEPAYRQLPNDRRAAWSAHKPPRVYTLAR